MQSNLKADKRSTDERRKTATAYNAVEVNADRLPVLTEHFCEYRGEPVAHLRCEDGRYMCMSGNFCPLPCVTKLTGSEL